MLLAKKAIWGADQIWARLRYRTSDQKGAKELKAMQNLVLYLKGGKTEIITGVINVREVGDRIYFQNESGEQEFKMQEIVFFTELEKIEGMLLFCNTLDDIVNEMVEERLKESAQKIFTMGMLTAYMAMGRS